MLKSDLVSEMVRYAWHLYKGTPHWAARVFLSQLGADGEGPICRGLTFPLIRFMGGGPNQKKKCPKWVEKIAQATYVSPYVGFCPLSWRPTYSLEKWLCNGLL
jgi:hypothetical protein